MDPSDADQLAARAASGDGAAFRALVVKFHARLWRLAWRSTGERATAEDLLQEVWLKVHRALPGYRAGEPFAPFLHRIAANAACDALRRRAARPQGDVIPLDLAASGPDPEAVVRALQRARRMRVLLAAVPEDQRQALVLRHYVDLSYEEIAEATGRPVGTVKTLIHRGRQRLRVALEGGEADEWTA